MAVRTAMFLFEVVVESVKSLGMVENRGLVIKSDFANIFSLELKDPKQMHIVMPEPLPLPPEPPGKKGKKKKKPKPKPKKGKKGKKKKGKVEVPPPEPLIQSGQSVLFASSAEVLIQNMMNSPLELSLWSKEETLVFIGTTTIPWDPIFITYLTQIANCEEPPPVTLKDEYNIFEEGKGKLIAKISIQVKLTFLNDKLTTAFRTLSEDPTIRKFLYTGINSKTTSYMCTLKSTDEAFEENCKKIENKFIVDKPKPTKIAFADYKNAPGANLAFFNENDYCCMGHADKPPESIYKSPETCPDIDFIIDYVRKIIVSCNDNLRMLTPRPTITPRVKATDIDRLCYCRETAWPKGAFAERFKNEAVTGPCPLCIDSGKKPKGSRAATFDIANIRGPCGKPECKIARDIRAYIENLVDEDNVEFKIDDLIGPCGSKECTLATTIQDFLRHEGVFTHGATLEGTSTQCACIEKMKDALTKRESCESVCSKDCENASSESSVCEGKGCPFQKQKVFDVFYFTVQYDFENKPDVSPVPSGNQSGVQTPEGKASGSKIPESKTSGSKSPVSKASGSKSPVSKASGSKSPETKAPGSKSPESKGSGSKTSEGKHKVRICHPECPYGIPDLPCSKSVCNVHIDQEDDPESLKCIEPVCPMFTHDFPPSPADSNIELRFDEIHNLCCVKSCEIAERVKDFIAEGVIKKTKCQDDEKEDPCFCDCVCTFKFSNKTTYCAVCGGYECLGDDMRYQPEHIKPHPCPVYHKLYDKKYIKVKSPWPENDQTKGTGSTKSSKAASKLGDKNRASKGAIDKKGVPEKKVTEEKRRRSLEKKDGEKPGQDGAEEEKVKNKQKAKKGEGDRSKRKKPEMEKAVVQKAPIKKEDLKYKYHYPPVPSNMGWNWVAEDVPGMKIRPNWKPGAANAILVRRYRTQREGGDSLNKKKRALMQRKKKIEMKPTLVVTKRDGEFTVQMEVFKKFSKERLLFQYPYDEKPPLIYTIGKTAEEKRKIQRQRDRRERRETRRKSRLLQSTFRDRCQEICLKAYNQAIGLLPLPNPNAPDCPCAGKPLHISPPIIDSCSCSDIATTISTSDTDNDEWVIEFTPPAARWDAKAKHPPVLAENETMYSYLDYKVKVLDKTGNQVPRFFKGPDGKQECSDLGGFWGTVNNVKTWLEINKDGYIGPDERWVPMNFIGLDGMMYSSEEGVFTDTQLRVWKIGVDGYIDKDGKWVFYPKKKGPSPPKTKSTPTASTVDAKKGTKNSPNASTKAGDCKNNKKEATSTKAKTLDDKNKAIVTAISPSPMLKHTKNKENVKNPHNPNKIKSPIVMSVSTNFGRRPVPRVPRVDRKLYLEQKAMAKYREIIEELRAYDDIGDVKPPRKANRASNTPLSQLSTFTMQGQYTYDKRMPTFTGDRSIDFGTSSNLSRVDSQIGKSINVDQ